MKADIMTRVMQVSLAVIALNLTVETLSKAVGTAHAQVQPPQYVIILDENGRALELHCPSLDDADCELPVSQ